MKEIIVAIVGILAFAFALVLVGLGAWVIQMNGNDIIRHGFNFWNSFWILLICIVFFGGASKAGKK